MPIKISIPEPCLQAWTDMSPTEKGRYCNSCEKEVIDFRDWTNEQLQNWFLSNRGQTCGLFFQEQITVDNLPTKRSRWNFSKGMFLASALTLSASSKVYSKPAVTMVYEENKSPKSNFPAEYLETDTLITISGRVKDFKDGIDLLGVKVSMLNGQSTITDAYGRFTLKTRVKKESKVILFFDYKGYRIEDHVFNPLETENIKIELGKPEKQVVEVLGGAIVCVSAKPSLPKRIWNFIKRPFASRH